jgi:putative glutathione S-transferase
VVEVYDLEGIEQKSVPLLYDKVAKKAVNNDSADIVRMLGMYAVELGSSMSPPPALYPAADAAAVDSANEWIYHTINNGAYKAGFTGSQDSYEENYAKYFDSVARLNEIFSRQEFVAGNQVTEADIRLFPTVFEIESAFYLFIC